MQSPKDFKDELNSVYLEDSESVSNAIQRASEIYEKEYAEHKRELKFREESALRFMAQLSLLRELYEEELERNRKD